MNNQQLLSEKVKEFSNSVRSDIVKENSGTSMILIAMDGGIIKGNTELSIFGDEELLLQSLQIAFKRDSEFAAIVKEALSNYEKVQIRLTSKV